MSWKPRTFQEKKANQEGWCRPGRRPHNLPDSWDSDCSAWRDRCWKRHRKTQYKVKTSHPKKSSKKFAEHMARRDHFYLDHMRCGNRKYRCHFCWEHKIWEEMEREEWLQKLFEKWVEKLARYGIYYDGHSRDAL